MQTAQQATQQQTQQPESSLTQQQQQVQEMTPEQKRAELFKKVGSFKKETNNQNPSPQTEEGKFDFKEYQAILEQVKDPNQRAVIEKAYKSFEAGYNKKFQSLAEQRKEFESKQKEFESKLQQMQQNPNRQWTADEVRKLVNDPTFVQAAKMVAEEGNPTNSGMSDDEWSSLSDSEKLRFRDLQNRLAELESKNMQESMQRKNMELDSQLKEKYPNYDPVAIDTLTAELLSGKYQATREDLYKARFHDDNVANAYELGRQEALREIQEKNNASSFRGNSVNGSIEVKAEPGERTESVFSRIARQRLAEAGNNIRK